MISKVVETKENRENMRLFLLDCARIAKENSTTASVFFIRIANHLAALEEDNANLYAGLDLIRKSNPDLAQ